MNIYYEKSKSLLLEMTGSLLVAIGLANFAAAFEFPMTGFSGIALILYRLFHIPLGFTNLILNIPIAIFCYRLLGKQFFYRVQNRHFLHIRRYEKRPQRLLSSRYVCPVR